MISCTEFIPSYSELFTYLEEKYGRDEVDRFWSYLFDPARSACPLVDFVKKEGIRGCFTYWKGTLNEEAADFTMYLNEKAGWFMIDMHHCPSKGRLLDLEKAIGIKPYHHYCLHCDHYRESVAEAGLAYIYNFLGIDHASCRLMVYDPKVFDGRVIIDENTEIMDRKASDNEYFHRGFHNSMNMGLEYLGTKHGVEDIREYLTRYAKHVKNKVIDAAKKTGSLKPLEDMILDTYAKEHAEDAVITNLSADGKTLSVKISWCPALKFFEEDGKKVTRWYDMATTVVMDTIASEIGAKFEMKSYDPVTGAAEYSFAM